MKKRKEQAFGKDVYLLGKSKKTERYLWLEAPSWDCSWYWGFGYVEEYTRHKSPQMSSDIAMHTHWNSIHKAHKYPFSETTFTDKEYNTLKFLFEQFYMYKKEAESYRDKDMPNMVENVNNIIIPAITKRIIDILTPE